MRRRRAVEALPEAEREHPRKDLRSLFWNFLTLSALLVAVFGYLLPQRFLARAQMPHEEMMGTAGEMMAHDGGHGAALLHEEGEVKNGIAVNLNFTPPLPETGKEVKLNFFVNLKPKGEGVSVVDLEVQHEKKMHVIGVRSDLNEFFHIHPLVTDADLPWILTANHAFRKPGEYKIWSEIKYQGEDHVFGHPTIPVRGAGPTSELQKEISVSKIVDRYQVAIDYHDLAAGAENHLDFLVRDLEGRKVELDNYLGEKMHLSVISEDLKHFIHTHPSGAHDDNMQHAFLISEALAHGALSDEKPLPEDHIPFVFTPPEKGFYRAFAEFRPKNMNLPPDTALHAEFWIEVAETTPLAVAPISSWWGLLFMSLILMTALSYWVKKYVAAPESK